MIGDDVAFRTGGDLANSQDRELTRGHLPRDHRLQTHDDHRGKHNGVYGQLGHRAVTAAAIDRDAHAGGR